MFYDEIQRVCAEKGVKPTTILKECGLSSGNMSKWKGGTSPTVDIASKLAKQLGVSLSYLCNASDIVEVKYPEKYRKWIDVIDRIPEEKRDMCIAFLQTHMAEDAAPRKYVEKIG